MKRMLGTLIIAMSVALGLLGWAACGEEAAPIPTVAVTSAEYSFSLPDSVPGGLTRVVQNNTGKEPHQVQLFQLNQGVTLPQFQGAIQAALQAPPGSPQQGEAFGKALGMVTLEGGPGIIGPGQKNEAVVDLKAGQYVLVCFVSSPDGAPHVAKGMAKPLTVTASPAKQPAPPKAVGSVTLNDFAFTGVPTLSSGKTTLKITNNGKEPHEMGVLRLKGGVTAAQARQLLTAPPTPGQAPPPGPPPWDGAGGLQAVSPGATAWATLDLTPGEYLLVCFVPSPANQGKPHVALGMLSTFTIK